MPHYFKPLRRKLGVVTLVMACAFAVGSSNVSTTSLSGIGLSCGESAKTIVVCSERAKNNRDEAMKLIRMSPSNVGKPYENIERFNVAIRIVFQRIHS